MIRKGELSPVELTRSALERIARLDPSIHAFIKIDEEGALEAARLAEKEVKAGAIRGSLHGVPVGIKDIIDVKGLPTTCHSKVLQHNIATSDAQCVKLLRDSGAIIIGKLATYEFATGGVSQDLPWPPARNPWDQNRHPGGSSSGSGAAVAAGFVPLALGTDTGGSVRHPAGACGIVGLKPTYGRVSRRGVFPLSPPLDTVGLLARTVDDIARASDVLFAYDKLDPGSARPGREASLASGTDFDLKGLRIGFVRHFHEEDTQADPEVTAALQHVANTLAAEGAQVREVRLLPLPDMAAAAMLLQFSHGWSVHAQWLSDRPQDYGQITRQRLMSGAFFSASDLVRANSIRSSAIAAAQEVFKSCDVLLCANSMDPPCRIDQPEELRRTLPRQARMPFSLTGHPALGMSAGMSRLGVPLSLQFVGKYFDEAMLLRVARGWERVSGVNKLRPPLD